MTQLLDIVKALDWTPLYISLKTGVVTTIICFFIGIALAYYVWQSHSFIGDIVDGVLTLPLVLPPTVAGFCLLVVFSPRRPVGAFLGERLGVQVVQTWLGCIIAAAVIALPLMYRSAKSAFEQIDANLIYVSRTLGMSELKIFVRIILPLARPGLLSGMILTFARALGEYGATSMLAGNIPGRTGTISQSIALVLTNGDYLTAAIWTVIVSLIALICIVSLNAVTKRRR